MTHRKRIEFNVGIDKAIFRSTAVVREQPLVVRRNSHLEMVVASIGALRRGEYDVRWKFNGLHRHMPVKVNYVGEDEEAVHRAREIAHRIAVRVKDHIEACPDAGDEEEIKRFKDKCVADEMQSEAQALVCGAAAASSAEAHSPAYSAPAASSIAAEEVSPTSAARRGWVDATKARALIEEAKKNAAAKEPNKEAEPPIYNRLLAELEGGSGEDKEEHAASTSRGSKRAYGGALQAFAGEMKKMDLDAPSPRERTDTYGGALQAAVLRGAQRCSKESGSDVQTVVPLEPRWAAKVFATEGPLCDAKPGETWTGVKSQEVRSKSINIRGCIGIAITEAPSLIVGTVNLDGVEELTRDQIAQRQEQTCLPPEELDSYVKGHTGYIWHLSRPFLFVDPIPQVTDGQTWKGKPNEHEQLLISLATRRPTGTSDRDINTMIQLFEGYQVRQARPDQKEERQLSRQLKVAAHPPPKRNVPLTPSKAHAEKLNRELQRQPLTSVPPAKRTKLSHRRDSHSEEDRDEAAPSPMDTVAQVNTIKALTEIEARGQTARCLTSGAQPPHAGEGEHSIDDLPQPPQDSAPQGPETGVATGATSSAHNQATTNNAPVPAAPKSKVPAIPRSWC